MIGLIRLLIGVLIMVAMNVAIDHRRETIAVSVSASAQ